MLYDMTKINKPLVIGIAEPKVPISSMPQRFLDSMGYTFFEDNGGRLPNLWLFVRADVRTGCFLIDKSEQQITVAVHHYGRITHFTMVYGSNTRTTRRDLWKSMKDVKDRGITNWFVMGDFNICLGAHEKLGGDVPRAQECNEFMTAIQDCELIDLHPTDPFLTWVNKQDGKDHIQVCLDHILHDEDSLLFWDSVKCIVLPRHCSDHSPLMLMGKKSFNSRVRPFRFRSMWTDYHCFMSDTEKFWKGLHIEGNPVYVLQSKLKQLRNFLRDWNRHVFGDIEHQKEMALKELLKVQEDLATEGFSDALHKAEIDLHDKINFLTESRRKLQLDSCKVKWLQQGDRNTAFFHALHSHKKATAGISVMKVGDTEITDNAQRIEHHILDFYEKLFNSDNPTPDLSKIQEVVPNMVTEAENMSLLRVPSVMDIKDTVFHMDPSSAPGPDGFTGHFFKTCWNFVGIDLVKAVQFMFSSGSFPAGINSIFMTLIPKVEDATSIDQYRPIALGNFVFKVVTKIVGERLASIVPRILSPNQFGFVRGRHIESCIVGASECLNLMNRSTAGNSLAFKIDVRKAFDTLNWDFIIGVLTAFGFSIRFCDWIRSLLQSARISVLINGTPKGYLKCSRGVRQGDPISPLLFVIAEDYLSRRILQNVSDKKIELIKSTRGACPSHLLYADDIIVFCKATTTNAKAFREILKDYECLSGQVVNEDKSTLYFGKNMDKSTARRVCNILGVKEGFPPFVYLGLPIFVGKVRRSHLRVVHDKIIMKFSTWKGNSLSFMGRLALMRSVIYGSLMHSFSIFKWPISLLKEMEARMRNFLWSGNVLKTSHTTVSWYKCCMPREDGGLGHRNLRQLNEAMLAKFAFKIMAEKDLIYDFLRARFIHNGTLWNCPFSSTLWLSLKASFKDVFGCCQWIPGISSSLCFWTDNWLGYRLVDRLNLSKKDCRHLRGSISDYRSNGAWELPSRPSLSEEISNDIRKTKFGHDDSYVCKVTNDGKATAKGLYSFLGDNHMRKEWGKDIWKHFIPPSRSFQLWRLLHKRTPVDYVFKKQGIIMASQCSLCLKDEETLNHLFVECSFAKGLWGTLASLFELNSGSLSPWNLFQETRKAGLSSQLWALWQVGFFEIIWLIWHIRNQARHDEKHLNLTAACKQILLVISAAKVHKIGHMNNAVEDLLILRKIGIQGIPRKSKIAIPVIWCPPPRGIIKINIDGAAIRGKAAAGGVFRHYDGRVLAAFSANLQPCSALEAELQSVMIASQLISSIGIKRIWIETDSMLVYGKLVSKESSVPWSLRPDWEAMLLMLNHIDFKVSHIYREGNRAADFFAGLGFVQNGIQWWSYFPNGSIDILVSDAISLGSYRIR